MTRSQTVTDGILSRGGSSLPAPGYTRPRPHTMKISLDVLLRLQEFRERHNRSRRRGNRLRSLSRAVSFLLDFYETHAHKKEAEAQQAQQPSSRSAAPYSQRRIRHTTEPTFRGRA